MLVDAFLTGKYTVYDQNFTHTNLSERTCGVMGFLYTGTACCICYNQGGHVFRPLVRPKHTQTKNTARGRRSRCVSYSNRFKLLAFIFDKEYEKQKKDNDHPTDFTKKLIRAGRFHKLKRLCLVTKVGITK